MVVTSGASDHTGLRTMHLFPRILQKLGVERMSGEEQVLQMLHCGLPEDKVERIRHSSRDCAPRGAGCRTLAAKASTPVPERRPDEVEIARWGCNLQGCIAREDPHRCGARPRTSFLGEISQSTTLPVLILTPFLYQEKSVNPGSRNAHDETPGRPLSD
jgi:hypothetical protein